MTSTQESTPLSTQESTPRSTEQSPHPIARSSSPDTARRRWLPFFAALGAVVIAQGVLAMVIVAGGNPIVGAVAAATLAICSLILVMAAAIQTRR